MKRPTTLRSKTLPSIALLCAAALPMLPAQDAPAKDPTNETGELDMDKALESLGKSAEIFVTAFNGGDAAAIAALFTPLGEIIDTDGSVLSGREAIEANYSDQFSGEMLPQIALEASGVRLIAPGMAVEDGLVHLTIAEDEPVRSISYTVTHVKQPDGAWLIASSRSLTEVTQPSEQLKPLHWMIGEWTLENEEGVRIDMGIVLDGRENFLLGEALVTNTSGEAQTTSFRLGWNPATASIYWWTFDSEGGNASGSWARGGGEWIVHTTGVTADAESSSSSQTLFRDGDTMVWIATQRILAGEALPDLTYRFVRRAPDPISLLAPEDVEEPAETQTDSDAKGE